MGLVFLSLNANKLEKEGLGGRRASYFDLDSLLQANFQKSQGHVQKNTLGHADYARYLNKKYFFHLIYYDDIRLTCPFY